MPLIVQREDPDRERFKVFDGHQYVGRIYETPTGHWYWSVDLLLIAGKKSIDGVADTRLEALAQLKATWERIGPSITR